MATDNQGYFNSQFGANLTSTIGSTLQNGISTAFANKNLKNNAKIDAGNLRAQAETLIEDASHNLELSKGIIQDNMQALETQMASSGFKVSSDSVVNAQEKAMTSYTQDYDYNKTQAIKQYHDMRSQADQIEKAAKEAAKNNMIGALIGGAIGIGANLIGAGLSGAFRGGGSSSSNGGFNINSAGGMH
jgi:hypothetical protein